MKLYVGALTQEAFIECLLAPKVTCEMLLGREHNYCFHRTNNLVYYSLQ